MCPRRRRTTPARFLAHAFYHFLIFLLAYFNEFQLAFIISFRSVRFFYVTLPNGGSKESEEDEKKLTMENFFVLIIFAPFHKCHSSNDIAKKNLLKSRSAFNTNIHHTFLCAHPR
jgi:hypothetical protein